MKHMARGEYGTLKRTGILLALAGFCLYLPTLFQSFIADDNIYLAFKNKFLRNSSWGDWYQAFTGRTNPWEYLPLRDLSYWLDFRLYGHEGMGFHASNLIWYALAALAAGLLFRELILLCRPGWSDRATALAWCGAALFIVHPVHVEATAWVASRKDLMSGCFALLSAFTLTRNLRMQWSFGGSALAALLLLAACFSKATGVAMTLFEIVLILSCWNRTPGNRNAFTARHISLIRKLVPLILLCSVAALSIYISMKVGAETSIRAPGNSIPLMAVTERASRILAALVKLLVWPHPLGLYHDVYVQGIWHWAASGLLVAAALAAFLALLLQPMLWAFGVVLILVPCLVYLQFTPFGTWSLASERFVFVPVAGMILIALELCGRLPVRRALLLVLMLFLPMAALTWQRIGEWDNASVLFEHDYAHEPTFHNAIRDQVIPLMVKGMYQQAKTLTAQIQRPWAVALLDALIDVKQASDKLAKHAGSTAEFCSTMSRLRAARNAANTAMQYEPDLSYGNLLGTVRNDIDERYAYLEQRNCVNAEQTPATSAQ